MARKAPPPSTTPSSDTSVSRSGTRPRPSSGAARADASGARETPTPRERRALLAAAEAVLTEKGFARTTVQDVAERAGLEADRFYAHFEGMGAVLRALNEAFVERLNAATDASTQLGIWKGAPARDVVEVAVRTVLDVVLDHAGLVRAFLVHGATDPQIVNGLKAIGKHLVARVVAVLGETSGAPLRGTRVVAYALDVAVALAHHHVLVGDDWAGVTLTRAELAEETSRMITAYLGLEPTLAIREASMVDGATAPVRAAVLHPSPFDDD